MHAFLHRCLTRTPILGLLMAAVLFRALIPAGFMPTQAESGEIVMQLCSGFETRSVVVDLGSRDAGHDASQLFDHSPCGFTASAMAAPPPFVSGLALATRADSVAPTAGASLPAAPPLDRAHSPRAPPVA